jgi:hypothetical protein
MSASIPVFSDRPKAAPTPKLRALVKFPGNVDATTGLSVEKTNGTWTFELDYSEFALSAAPAPGTSTYILSYDPVTGVYLLVPTQLVAGASEAYVDAQNAAQDTANSAADALRVLKTGDTMTGNLEIADAAPVLTLRKSASGQSCAIVGITGSSFTRWAMSLGNSAAEVGSNTGSHFEIARYNDAGSYLGSPFSINRATGEAAFAQQVVVNASVVAQGYRTRSGTPGPDGGNSFNIQWPGPELWIDGSNVGNISIVSDYRIKKDVTELPGMWDTVKALRPIKYTQAQFSPPSHVKFVAEEVLKARQDAENDPEAKPREVNADPLFAADDIERWGFIAHELQETLTPSAASGVKDSPDTIQSPNPWTVIAALTKTLQEAMARIEALEGPVATKAAAPKKPAPRRKK